jgi:hypothetical protein
LIADRRPRPRVLTGALLLVSIALGLASRRFPALLPQFIATYAGDALWAAMVYWIAALAFPSASIGRLASIAFGVALAVELSQLYHAPWIDAIRATRFGALALGYGFLWSDLACYAAGTALAAGIDLLLARRRTSA